MNHITTIAKTSQLSEHICWHYLWVGKQKKKRGPQKKAAAKQKERRRIETNLLAIERYFNIEIAFVL